MRIDNYYMLGIFFPLGGSHHLSLFLLFGINSPIILPFNSKFDSAVNINSSISVFGSWKIKAFKCLTAKF